MADLADFFAKKDKKKTKPKKFVPEDMGKKLEEAEKKQQERERREELKREHLREEQLEIDDPNHKKEPADEWQDEEEATVDLSDLNIQQLEQPEAGRAEGEVGPLDADGNPTGAQGSAWGWQKTGDWRRRLHAGRVEACSREPGRPGTSHRRSASRSQ
ncbi:protein CDV3 homolog [Pollicipes pollicipes]|uniref:protein CDV3 homolog n=1 Tax=Pollicipes pollicipes TaxID=41117 RepID=UPI001884B5E8|nr:protein CDV3 homolog [Pollicipes pollicipes]